MIPASMDRQIDELLGILDEEIELLDRKRSQLADLSAALVERDNDTTERLLEEIEQAQSAQESLDARLGGVRERLAETLGCAPHEVRLSRLAGELPLRHARAVADRRARIVDRAGALRTQHLKTALLLSECSRINGMLLQSMLPAAETVTTYGAGGTETWRGEAGLMDTEL